MGFIEDKLQNLDDRIGHTIRARRLSKNMRAEDVAARIGKSRDWLYRLERGGSWSVYNYILVKYALGYGSDETTDHLNQLLLDHRLGKHYPPLLPANP